MNNVCSKLRALNGSCAMWKEVVCHQSNPTKERESGNDKGGQDWLETSSNEEETLSDRDIQKSVR